ncbi:MAG: GMC family oxidoreductase N-terminal domain-containing protein [Devosia sp.]
MAEAQVLLVDFDGLRAVRVRRHSADERIVARNVVVAPGALHSPAVLMPSGLGPVVELR